MSEGQAESLNVLLRLSKSVVFVPKWRLPNGRFAGLKKTLVRYSASSRLQIDNLEEGILFCQHFSRFNDPFELRAKTVQGIPQAEIEPERFMRAMAAWGFSCGTIEEAKSSYVELEASEYFEECALYSSAFDTMRDSMRIACFTRQADNLLMWSHYGDGLRGMAIEFDPSALIEGAVEGVLMPVRYAGVPPIVDEFEYGVRWDQEWYHGMAIEEEGPIVDYKRAQQHAIKQMRHAWQSMFATKPYDWRYEREVRLLVVGSDESFKPMKRPYSATAIRRILIGERVPEDARRRIIKIAKAQYPHALVFEAGVSPLEYKIELRSL